MPPARPYDALDRPKRVERPARRFIRPARRMYDDAAARAAGHRHAMRNRKRAKRVRRIVTPDVVADGLHAVHFTSADATTHVARAVLSRKVARSMGQNQKLRGKW